MLLLPTEKPPIESVRKEPMIGSLFFFQAEDGIRDWSVTGVQTCALPILIDPIRCCHAGRRRGPRRGSRVGVAFALDAEQELRAYQQTFDRALDAGLETPGFASFSISFFPAILIEGEQRFQVRIAHRPPEPSSSQC